MKLHSFSILSLFSISSLFLIETNGLLQHEKYKAPKYADNVIEGQYIVEYKEQDTKHSALDILKLALPDFHVLDSFNHKLFNGAVITTKDPNPSTLIATPHDLKIRSFLDHNNIKAMYPVEMMEMEDAPNVKPTENPADLISPHKLTQVDRVHNELKMTGKNMTIAVIDSGVDFLHPALGGGFGPGFKVVAGADLVGDHFDPNNPPPPNTPPLDNCGADTKANGHGTHVSGIIIGKSDNFTGVAPDAQIAAWRIYDCNRKGNNKVILKALLEAYDKKCDVVSLSLGSPNKAAIEIFSGVFQKMMDAGIIIVAAGGNSGPEPFTIEYPGLYQGVISVGSFDNSYNYVPTFKTNGSLSASISYDTEKHDKFPSGELIIGASNIQACTPSDVPADIKGKYGLVQRGNCTYLEKINKLADAGAIGIIVFDNSLDDAITPDVGKIPALGIGLADGNRLVDAIKNGPLYISFDNEKVPVPGKYANTVSFFSSIGSDIDLQLRPNIAGVGGHVYSTLPKYLGGYGVMSGTSMATPYISATVALYLELFKKGTKPKSKYVLEQLQNYAYKAPAKIGEEGIDNPLRQGAGLVQLYDAITKKVHISPGQLEFNDTALASLPFKKQTLIITNNFDKPVTYEISNNASLAIQPYDLEKTGYYFVSTIKYTSEPVSAELSFSEKTINIDPGKSVNITVTVTPPATNPKEHIMYGGYVQFKSSDTSVASDLTVPYFGVVGDQKEIPLYAPDYTYISDKDDGSTKYTVDKTLVVASNDTTVYVFAGFVYHSGGLDFELIDNKTNQVIGTPIQRRKFIPRNTLSDKFTTFPWDVSYIPTGNTTRVPVPNGVYNIRLKALKPFGNPQVPTDFSLWTSSPIEIKK
ncbi:unnamed protein product [Cunninghamella blakesleeana]